MWYGVGPIHRITGAMVTFLYYYILDHTKLTYVDESKPLRRAFKQDNNPKLTSMLGKNRFQDNNFSLLDWSSLSPDLGLS